MLKARLGKGNELIVTSQGRPAGWISPTSIGALSSSAPPAGVAISINPTSIGYVIYLDVLSLRPPVGYRRIAVRARSWPRTLPTPWGAGQSGSLTLTLLDLLRCTTRYFFIESWLAGQTEGWVFGLPVVEYLEEGPEFRWQRRNANVARWLSEMAGVGLSCYVMERCGAANIVLGNNGFWGPDYSCRLTINGRATTVWFEAKASSTRAGVVAQERRARRQVAPYKKRRTLGLTCISCVPVTGTTDQPCIYLADPPVEGHPTVSEFQHNIAGLAASVSWAGEPEVGREIASAVMSFEDGAPKYLPPKLAREEIRRRCRSIAESLDRLIETGAERTVPNLWEGRLKVRLPVENLQNLLRLCRERAVEEFQITRVDWAETAMSEHASFAPDGSGFIWRPNEHKESG